MFSFNFPTRQKFFFVLFFKCGQSFVDRLFFDHLRSIFLFQLHVLIFLDKHCRWRHFVFFPLEVGDSNSFFLRSFVPTRTSTRIHTHNELNEFNRVQFSSLLSLLCFARFPVKRIEAWLGFDPPSSRSNT